MTEAIGPPDSGRLEKILDWATSIDVAQLELAVARLQAAHPLDSNVALAQRVYSRKSWKAGLVGFSTGLPASLLMALPAAAIDAGTVLRMEINCAATAALIFEPRFFESPDANWELLVPILGITTVSQGVREFGVLGAEQLTRRALHGLLTRQTLAAFRRFMLKHFGLKVGRRALIAKTVPVVGGVIGGLWNLVELRLQGRRVIRYFSEVAA